MKFIPDIEDLKAWRPTNTCFDDAAALLLEIAKDNPSWVLEEQRLVHALCRMSKDGERFCPAWIEHGRFAYHCQLDGKGNRFYVEVPKYILYRRFHVVRTYKYTPREARTNSLNRGGSGPWVPELKELCLDAKIAAEAERKP